MQQTMTIIKKNLLSIICGIIAFAAVVASYYPTGGWYDALKAKLDARAKVASTIDSLKNKQRMLPNIRPDNTTPKPLTVFPTEDVIETGKQAVAKVDDESKKIVGVVQDRNVHTLLVPDSLPNPTPQSAVTFKRQYAVATQNVPSDPKDPQPDAIVRTLLDAGRPYTQPEIEAFRTQLKADLDRNVIVSPTGAEDPDSRRMADEEFARQSADLPTRKQTEVADSHKMYLIPGAISWDPSIVTSQTTPPDYQIWNDQLGLWIAQDVAKGLATANKSATKVSDAAVKNLVALKIPQQPYIVSGNPADLKTTVDTAFPKAPNVSVTGRASNGMYTVVQFTLELHVDGRRVPDVLENLEKGQMITILNTNVMPVDRATQMLQGIIYGNQPVVDLTMACEELFMNSWATPLMPQSVQNMLATLAATNVPGAPPGAAPAAPAGSDDTSAP